VGDVPQRAYVRASAQAQTRSSAQAQIRSSSQAQTSSSSQAQAVSTNKAQARSASTQAQAICNRWISAQINDRRWPYRNRMEINTQWHLS